MKRKGGKSLVQAVHSQLQQLSGSSGESGGDGSSGSGNGGSLFAQQLPPELRGATVDIESSNNEGTITVRFVRQLDEGGFSFVFLVRCERTGRQYALKRIIMQTKEMYQQCMREINFMKQLQPHDSIIKLAGTRVFNNGKGVKELYILMDLAKDQLIDVLRRALSRGTHIPQPQVLRIFLDIVNGVAHMHAQRPQPLIHRDLKVENVLVVKKNDMTRFVLCDFGSCTTKVYHLNTREERMAAEDDIQRNTTMAYRSPEMADLYSGDSIGPKSDVWALGCVLYKMCFFQGPFEEAGTLQIISGKWSVPKDKAHIYSKELIDLIKFMLVVEVDHRPDVFQVRARVERMLGMNLTPAPAFLPAEQPKPKREARTPQKPKEQKKSSNDAIGGDLFDMLDWQDNSSGSSNAGMQQQSQQPGRSTGAFVQPKRPQPPTLQQSQSQSQQQKDSFDDDWADFSDFISSTPSTPSVPNTPQAQQQQQRPSRAAQVHKPLPSTPARNNNTKQMMPSSTPKRGDLKVSVKPHSSNKSNNNMNGSGDLFDQLDWMDNNGADGGSNGDDGNFLDVSPSQPLHKASSSPVGKKTQMKYVRHDRTKSMNHQSHQDSPTTPDDNLALSTGDVESWGTQFAEMNLQSEGKAGSKAKMANVRHKWSKSSGHTRSLSAQIFKAESNGAHGDGFFDESTHSTSLDQLLTITRPSLSVKEVFDVHNLSAMRSKDPARLWVLKATSSAKTEPKPKYVRQLTMAMWKDENDNDSQGRYQESHIDRVMLYFRGRPIFNSPLVCFKALTTIHHIVQDGPQSLLKHMQRNKSLLIDIEETWSESMGTRLSGGSGGDPGSFSRDAHFVGLIEKYSQYLIDRVTFHGDHPSFESNFSLEQLVRHAGGAVGEMMSQRESPFSLDTVHGLLSLLERINSVVGVVFQDKANACKIGCLIPLVYDAQDIYRSSTWLLSKLARVISRNDNELQHTVKRYNAVYRQFFQQILAVRNFRPVASVVTSGQNVLQDLKSQPPTIPNNTLAPPTSIAMIKDDNDQGGSPTSSSTSSTQFRPAFLRVKSSISLSSRRGNTMPSKWPSTNSLSDGFTKGDTGDDSGADSDLDETEYVDADDTPSYYVGDDGDAVVNGAQDAPHSGRMMTLDDCLRMPGNKTCADCGTNLNTVSKWASINLGIFICQQCSGFHRGLGVHISKVRSVSLDKWSDEQIQFMSTVGNARANRYWEETLDKSRKPAGCSDLEKVGDFIRKKYAERKWVKKKQRNTGRPIRSRPSPAPPVAGNNYVSNHAQTPPSPLGSFLPFPATSTPQEQQRQQQSTISDPFFSFF